MSISIASKEDVQELAVLINSAYRGDASKKGWTTEADLLKGELRTDISTLTDLIDNPQSVILKYTTAENVIAGSVYLEIQKKGLYLGMLTVSPLLQAAGIGRQILLAAEEYAKEKECPCIFMSVISVRHELIAWYERHGYKNSGETKPFPDDDQFGIPTQFLEFIIMEKIM